MEESVGTSRLGKRSTNPSARQREALAESAPDAHGAVVGRGQRLVGADGHVGHEHVAEVAAVANAHLALPVQPADDGHLVQVAHLWAPRDAAARLPRELLGLAVVVRPEPALNGKLGDGTDLDLGVAAALQRRHRVGRHLVGIDEAVVGAGQAREQARQPVAVRRLPARRRRLSTAAPRPRRAPGATRPARRRSPVWCLRPATWPARTCWWWSCSRPWPLRRKARRPARSAASPRRLRSPTARACLSARVLAVIGGREPSRVRRVAATWPSSVVWRPVTASVAGPKRAWTLAIRSPKRYGIRSPKSFGVSRSSTDSRTETARGGRVRGGLRPGRRSGRARARPTLSRGASEAACASSRPGPPRCARRRLRRSRR